jgi:hypothetical protein
MPVRRKTKRGGVNESICSGYCRRCCMRRANAAASGAIPGPPFRPGPVGGARRAAARPGMLPTDRAFRHARHGVATMAASPGSGLLAQQRYLSLLRSGHKGLLLQRLPAVLKTRSRMAKPWRIHGRATNSCSISSISGCASFAARSSAKSSSTAVSQDFSPLALAFLTPRCAR